MMSGMLTEAGVKRAQHDSVTVGGHNFVGHVADERVPRMLRSWWGWDVVVLQDKSTEPGGWSVDALVASRNALEKHILPLVPKNARLLLYSTWGHLEGSVYEESRPAYPDYVTMQRKTTQGYKDYATLIRKTRGVEIIPVGDAFELLYNEEKAAGKDPTADGSLFNKLFVLDKIHPSRLGTYLAACVFMHALGDEEQIAASKSYRPPPKCAHDDSLMEELKYGPDWRPAPMSEEEAATLFRIAAEAVKARGEQKL
jgi:hypothetical protein